MRQQKCKFADSYKAMYAPKCGCEACWEKWDAKQRALASRKRRVVGRERERDWDE